MPRCAAYRAERVFVTSPFSRFRGPARELLFFFYLRDEPRGGLIGVHAWNDSTMLLAHVLSKRLAEALDEFVDSLPINGRTGILKLLDAACLPPEELAFVETIRKVRNIYAHDIKPADVRLIDLVKQRNDKAQLLKYLSGIETYVEADLIAWYERDPGFLTFCVIDSTMRFLFYSYHMAVKFPTRR